jgi:two-component system, response regulator YesN
MINTIIVDDEPSIRKGLKVIIDWEKLGFKIIGEASNGREALLLIEKEKPDLVITDIKMPEMSGLELIKKFKNLYTHTSYIILSGHGEFTLAREALHLGAFKYLLKPIDEDELELSLKEFKIKFDGKQSNILSKGILLKTELQRTIQGNINTENFNYLFNTADSKEFYYAFIEVHASQNTTVEILESIISNNVPKSSVTALIVEKNSWYGFFIYSGMLREYRNQVARFATKIVSDAFQNHLLDISLYIGERVTAISDLQKSRETAEIASSHRFYREKGTVIDFDSIKHINFLCEYNELKSIENIFKSISESNKEYMLEAIEGFILDVKEQYLASSIIYIHLNKLLNNIISIVSDLNGNVSEIIKNSSFIINREENIYILTLGEKIKELCCVSIDVLNQYKSKNSIALEFKNYIDAHYKENLSLKSVSEIIGVNSAYLGQVFKKSSGSNFNTYLHNLRINEAKKMLSSTNLKVYEIAESVGYQDVNYFMKKFETTVGTTPSNYRRNYSNI